MNDVDTAFVSQLSQGLQRRFEFVYVGVPLEDQGEEELQEVARQAANWYGHLYGEIAGGDLDGYANDFVDEVRVRDSLILLGQLVGFIRWGADGPRWPVGSAQLADVMRRVAVRAYNAPDLADLTDALDCAVANRIMQQSSGLTVDQLHAIENHLGGTPLARSLASLRQVREPHLTHRSQ